MPSVDRVTVATVLQCSNGILKPKGHTLLRFFVDAARKTMSTVECVPRANSSLMVRTNRFTDAAETMHQRIQFCLPPPARLS